MEHIEEAGMHSGDSACAIPPFCLPPSVDRRDQASDVALAEALNVRGLMNIQFAVKDGRASTFSRSTRGPGARCRSSPRRPA